MSLNPDRPITWAKSHVHMRAYQYGADVASVKERTEAGIENTVTKLVGGHMLGDGPFTEFEIVPVVACSSEQCNGSHKACSSIYPDSDVLIRLTLPEGDTTGLLAGKMFRNV